jgi:hypothetical protein
MRHGTGTNVEVLPLTMVNMLQNMSLTTIMHDVTIALENTHIIDDSKLTIKIPYQYNSTIPRGVDVSVSDLDTDMDNNEHCDEGFHQVEQIGDESEF